MTCQASTPISITSTTPSSSGLRAGAPCAVPRFGNPVITSVPVAGGMNQKMDDLIFYEKSHIYMLGGERIPCVSDLCRFLHREIYKDAPLWQMEAAAARGTEVHRATELLDKTGTAPISGEYAPYLQGYAAFRREHCVEWELIEHPDYHPEYGYAGTIDRYGKVDGFRTLMDIKTTYMVYKPLCSASLNLYRLILEARNRPVERLLILHLKKDGTYKLIRFDFDDSVPLSLITIHNALKKKRRKLK